MPEYLRIPLTTEQSQLYRTSPSFKAGADALQRSLAPTLLRGLAEEAKEADARIQAAISEMSKRPLDIGLFQINDPPKTDT